MYTHTHTHTHIALRKAYIIMYVHTHTHTHTHTHRALCKAYSIHDIEGSRPEWCISSMVYNRDTPFWLETPDIQISTKPALFCIPKLDVWGGRGGGGGGAQGREHHKREVSAYMSPSYPTLEVATICLQGQAPALTCTFCRARFSRRLPPWARKRGIMLTATEKIFNTAATAVSMLMLR